MLDPLVVPTLVVDRERTEFVREEARVAQRPVEVVVEAGDAVVIARVHSDLEVEDANFVELQRF